MLRINTMMTIDGITTTAGSIRAGKDIAGYKEIPAEPGGGYGFLPVYNEHKLHPNKGED